MITSIRTYSRNEGLISEPGDHIAKAVEPVAQVCSPASGTSAPLLHSIKLYDIVAPFQ